MARWIISILVTCLILTLQSCFVVNLRRDWTGQSKLQSENRKDKPYITATVGRKPHITILPCVFLEWGNKKYGVEFNFGSFAQNLEVIDSVQYWIYDSKDSLILNGTIDELQDKQARFTNNAPPIDKGNGLDSLSFGYCRSKYLYPLEIKQQPLLKMKAVAYINDRKGNTNEFVFDSVQLKRIDRAIGSFF